MRTGSPRRAGRSESDDIGTMHDVFSDWERRAILYYLQECGGPAAVREIAAHLVGWWRGDEAPASPDDPEVRRVREHLGNVHLIKMAQFGVVAFDPRDETVRLSDEMKVSVTEPWTEADAGDAESARLLGDAGPQ